MYGFDLAAVLRGATLGLEMVGYDVEDSVVVGGGCFGEVRFALVEDVEDGDGVSEAVVAAAELDACAGGFGLAAEEVETDAAGVVLEVVACELGDGFGGGLVLLFAAEAGVVDDENGFEFEEDALESGSRGL